jgi:hypothetical protein
VFRPNQLEQAAFAFFMPTMISPADFVHVKGLLSSFQLLLIFS